MSKYNEKSITLIKKKTHQYLKEYNRYIINKCQRFLYQRAKTNRHFEK